MPDPMAAGQRYEIGMEYDGDKVVRKEGAGNFSVGARTSWSLQEKNNFGIRAVDAGPLWMGMRLNTFKNGPSYKRLVYAKGDYVLHMLRYLMNDRETGDKDFIAMMHDFVQTCLHGNASTESFTERAHGLVLPRMGLRHGGPRLSPGVLAPTLAGRQVHVRGKSCVKRRVSEFRDGGAGLLRFRRPSDARGLGDTGETPAVCMTPSRLQRRH